ncbi:MAG: hypothetical protein EXX96DRAFT_549453 [Benjaminiella poitrasii]|nr:MAG: hypothetical protein EXX96DRAFT_549453 [Benjaminiella poitrasii]
MGVQGLWSLIGPAARPTQLESMRQKRIAVDASIWIHQFMRTMRDKEGNALKNGHLLGFFRRICKLLFFDIKPVFVFDGGAPSLKRNTIRERRKRREGIKVNLKATAKRILSAQLKAKVISQQEKKLHGEKDEKMDYVYVDQLTSTGPTSKKRKLDPYELPAIRKDELNSRLHQFDPRFVTAEELQSFVNEFDLSELDIDSDAFYALPAEVQYEIIQERTWKSRTTSSARLDEMVRGSKTALDFSKQQIKQLKYRNEMRQRLLQVNNASNGINVEPVRIASERGREYILYKNENLKEGLGWKLPGLSASDPVVLDPVLSHQEPKLEIPKDGINDSLPQEPEDKVAAAIASNPKLAALVENFFSDEDEEVKESETHTEEQDTNDEEPLFIEEDKQKASHKLIDDMDAYVHDEAAIQEVISRIYGDKHESIDNVENSLEEEKDVIETLNSDDFYELWLSRVPDAFIYLHSFNDEYKNMLKRAIEDFDMNRVLDELQSVHKQFGKTNEGDDLTLESLQFLEGFYESVIKWKMRQEEEIFEDVSERQLEDATAIQPPSEPMSDQSVTIMLDDEEDEEDIQFVDAIDGIQQNNQAVSDSRDLKELHDDQVVITDTDTVEENEPTSKITNEQHVHINMDQSLLQLSSSQSSTKHINQPTDHNTKQDDAISHTPALQSDKENDILSTENNLNEPYQVNEDIQEKETVNEQNVEDHGYNSEEELVGNVEAEEDEYARFVSDIASKKLDDIKNELYRDMKELNKQQRKEMGNSDDVTDQMVQDIQELLKLFGIPYIVSPMEAEAQCAELETLSLVDGTITDDSDVFLFGASRVYKNMFNQQRYVECYQRQDIEREMLLTRKKLIQLAFLLGSDYTEGIPGVGPVAAMEILAEFSGTQDKEEEEELKTPLERFKNWYNSGKDETPFQKKFRKRHNSLDIPEDFPNSIVIDAYYKPTVDDSSQKFEWGHPQLDSLRVFLMEAFGWSESKADEVLLPVLREMNKKKATGEQVTIGSYFNVDNSVSSHTGASSTGRKHSSKRVQNIVENWRKQKKTRKR